MLGNEMQGIFFLLIRPVQVSNALELTNWWYYGQLLVQGRIRLNGNFTLPRMRSREATLPLK